MVCLLSGSADEAEQHLILAGGRSGQMGKEKTCGGVG